MSTRAAAVETSTSGQDTVSPIGGERLEQLLGSMERILEMEEQVIDAFNAIETRVAGEDLETMSRKDLEKIKQDLMDLGTRMDRLIDSFNRIDDYLKRNGF